jgi:hypothetical protein
MSGRIFEALLEQVGDSPAASAFPSMGVASEARAISGFKSVGSKIYLPGMSNC